MKPNLSLGQYFTTNATLQTKVFSFIFNEPSIILEPCIGKGHLVSCVLSKIQNVQFDMFEIDNTIPILNTLTTRKNQIVYCDFITQNITKTYKTIIGNPPFIRHKKGNAYLDFVKKCFHEIFGNFYFVKLLQYGQIFKVAKVGLGPHRFAKIFSPESSLYRLHIDDSKFFGR